MSPTSTKKPSRKAPVKKQKKSSGNASTELESAQKETHYEDMPFFGIGTMRLGPFALWLIVSIVVTSVLVFLILTIGTSLLQDKGTLFNFLRYEVVLGSIVLPFVALFGVAIAFIYRKYISQE